MSWPRVHLGHGIGLRTADALSPAVSADQVFESIAVFGLIYLLLFIIWIYIMNDKIQKGPEYPIHAATPAKGGLMDTAAQMADPSGPSMTGARDTAKPDDADPESARGGTPEEG